MIGNQKVVVVLPAYNAARTLERTIAEIPRNIVDDVILVDDASQDETVEIARRLQLPYIIHEKNMGYGANQKTCYREALRRGADIIIMLHPDYQYTPKLIPAMAHLIHSGLFDVAIGSRILGGGALKGGMPLYKYLFNRFLTLIENVLTQKKLSEYHSGYRAFRREVLETLPLLENSDRFLFDNQILLQLFYFGFSIGEITCPASYFPEASSISFWRSCGYGLGVLWYSFLYPPAKWGLLRLRIFDKQGRKLQELTRE